MRIGINALFMIPGKHGGGEKYLRNLLTSLAKIDKKNKYIIFTNRSNSGSFGIKQDNFTEILCNFPARYKLFRIFWEQIILPFQVKKYRINVLHSLANVSPVIKFSNCKYIVTIHDIMYHHYPENYPKAQFLYLKFLLALSARRVDKIITVSKNNKKDIVENLSIPEDKISVIYTSGLPDKKRYELDKEEVKSRIKKKYNLNRNFILCVASFNPQKNIGGLLRAFYLIKKVYGLEHQLVLVGMLLRYASKLMNIIDELELNDYVKITGYIPDEDLPYLYSLADLYVFPSTFEGLGVTPLEAMACKCPVATSNIPALREVVGDAALLFNPYNAKEMAETIVKVLTNSELKKELIRKGLERSKQFSWEKTAAETLKVFEEVRL